jgi:SAM-dependent methyltransferase
MSRWTDQWSDFVTETSYVHNLLEEKISNDQFWRSYGIYDQALMHSGYPGEILAKISSFIPAKATLLDIGAGTGAFAIPLSRKTSRTIAVDPSTYQLQILSEKARREGLTNISTIEKEWKDVQPSEISGAGISGVDISGGDNSRVDLSAVDIPLVDISSANILSVDYSLAAYSLFDKDIENFLTKMIDVTKKGVFIVFRADSIDSLNEFAYGPRPCADYHCLYHILKDMGHQFDVILFPRNYYLPIDLVLKQYRYSKRDRTELVGHLRREGRLQEREDGKWAAFSTKDALLYLIR